MKKGIRALGLSLVVLLVGPLALAGLLSLLPQSRAAAAPNDAERLLRTFDDSFPQGIPMYTVDGDYYFRLCGYDRAEILGEFPRDKWRMEWTSYEAYHDLQRWFATAFSQSVEQARSEHLAQQLSGFELRFLNRCIANTALSAVCGYRVRKVLEQGNLYSKYTLPSSLPRPNEEGQVKTMCSFLDGIAARQGRKLGKAPAPSE